MNCLALMGSPRKNGNTAALLSHFTQELCALGAKADTVWLYDLDLRPCTACRACQRDWTGFGCPQEDDAHALFERILSSDLILLATPIYSWYCTPPMKALLDRMVYGMNKFYGAEKGPSLWEGKSLAALTTCGYPPEKGADLFAGGMERYCKHSRLRWQGLHCARDPGYDAVFMDTEKEQAVRAIARALYRSAPPGGAGP